MNKPFDLGFHFHGYPFPNEGVLSPAPTNIRYNAVRLHDAGVQWHVLNPQRGVYDSTRLDAILAAHPGKKFVYTMYGTPPFALVRPAEAVVNVYGDPGGRGAANPQDVQAFTTWLLNHCQGRIAAIEVWNEPRYDGIVTMESYFWGSAQEQVAMAVGMHMAINAYNGFDQTRPKVELWSPGFRCGQAEMKAFLNASYMMLRGKDIIDAIGWHPYSYCIGDADTSILTGWTSSVTTMRSLMAAEGISDKKLYITEYGVDGWASPRLNTFLSGPAAERNKYMFSLICGLYLAGVDGLYIYSFDHGQNLCGHYINDPQGVTLGVNNAAALIGIT